MQRKNQITRAIAMLVLCAAVGGVSMGQSSQAPASDTVISLSFSGGTVQQYVDAIRKQSGEVNVLLDEESRAILMPGVTLTSVNIPSAIELLDDRTSEADGRLVKLNVRTIHPSDPLGLPIYYVRAETGRTAQRSNSTVISVKDLLDAGYKADDVMTAVATTIELLSDKSAKAEIRFHEQTGLLIARGAPDQIGAIHQVIDQLREAGARSDQSRKFEAEAHKYYQQMLEMKDQMSAREAEINKMVQQMTEAQTRLENAKRLLEERETDMVKSQMRFQALQQELAAAMREVEQSKSKP